MTDERHLLTASQLRMARAALRYSVAQVAQLSGVSQSTIHKLERGLDHRTAMIGTIGKLEDFYRTQGLRFCPGEPGSLGVWIKDPGDRPGSGR